MSDIEDRNKSETACESQIQSSKFILKVILCKELKISIKNKLKKKTK